MVGHESLHWDNQECPQDITARVNRAEEEWGALWTVGEEATTEGTTDRAPITVRQMDHVLKQLSHLPSRELLVLPRKSKQGPLEIIHQAEEQGRWPQSIRETTIALIAKESANHGNSDQLDYYLTSTEFGWQ